MTQRLDMIREIGNEVLAYADTSRIQDGAIYAEMQENDVEDALHKLYRHANTIPTGPCHKGRIHSMLVRKMLEFAGHADAISSASADIAGTCFQAELRFVRSLARRIKSSCSGSESVTRSYYL
jgi:hypothetical protein